MCSGDSLLRMVGGVLMSNIMRLSRHHLDQKLFCGDPGAGEVSLVLSYWVCRVMHNPIRGTRCSPHSGPDGFLVVRMWQCKMTDDLLACSGGALELACSCMFASARQGDENPISLNRTRIEVDSVGGKSCDETESGFRFLV